MTATGSVTLVAVSSSRFVPQAVCVSLAGSCSHHPICNYTQRACALHKAQEGTKDYGIIVLYCSFTVIFISLLLFYTFKLFLV